MMCLESDNAVGAPACSRTLHSRRLCRGLRSPRRPGPKGAPSSSPGHTPSAWAARQRYQKATGGQQSGVTMATRPGLVLVPQPKAGRVASHRGVSCLVGPSEGGGLAGQERAPAPRYHLPRDSREDPSFPPFLGGLCVPVSSCPTQDPFLRPKPGLYQTSGLRSASRSK